eukprot:jgi/Chrzof1/11853/Cz06g12130.t1
MAEENVETVPKSEPGQPINLIIRDQHGQDVQFKVKPHIKFGKMFSAYCTKKAATGFRFIFDGERLAEDATPADFDMADGDIIEAVIEQTGGSSKLAWDSSPHAVVHL